ncbi:MAG: corrinoid protein [Spirochaetes bacterium]|nr:corrinoid protein [Spirochaetota bacterium]
MGSDVLKSIENAVVEMRFDDTEALTRQALDSGVTALAVLNGGLLTALERVGVLFRDGDYFLPDVLMSVKAYNNSYRLLDSELKKGNYKARGVVMLGTVQGDIHEIGKNILLALLQGNGFRVIDLGVDIPADTFLARAQEENPDIIGLSALLTTSMPAMKEVMDLFSARGVRERFKFVIGGAPVSQRYAEEIGADGYGEDAQAGVDLVKRLLA